MPETVHAKKKNLDDVVRRLRASRQRAEQESYREGEEAGRAWAEEHAEADELVKLERFRERCGPQWATAFHREGGAGWMFFQMRPQHRDDWAAAEGFWKQVLGQRVFRAEEPPFVKGFAEGALALWHEVKEKL